MLGLDPDPDDLWPPDPDERGQGSGLAPREAAAAAVLEHCRAVIDATASACVAVKLQLARFELLGPAGWEALALVAEHARRRGLLVIADGKRGDIDVSAAAYAGALFGGASSRFGRLEGLGADAVTVNPLMGADAVAPFVAAARESGGGVLLLVRTSNPGAAELQDVEIDEDAGGCFWERLARMVDRLGQDGVGEAGISDVGAVVGATRPGHLARARELMPKACLLMPGIGAQGGRVEDLAPAFLPGRAGGLVAASRSIAGAHRQDGGSPAQAARAEAARLREAAWALSGEQVVR